MLSFTKKTKKMNFQVVKFPMSFRDKFTYMQSEYNRLMMALKVHSKASYLIIKLHALFKPPKIMTADTFSDLLQLPLIIFSNHYWC